MSGNAPKVGEDLVMGKRVNLSRAQCEAAAEANLSGLGVVEVAAALGVSVARLKREWAEFGLQWRDGGKPKGKKSSPITASDKSIAKRKLEGRLSDLAAEVEERQRKTREESEAEQRRESRREEAARAERLRAVDSGSPTVQEKMRRSNSAIFVERSEARQSIVLDTNPPKELLFMSSNEAADWFIDNREKYITYFLQAIEENEVGSEVIQSFIERFEHEARRRLALEELSLLISLADSVRLSDLNADVKDDLVRSVYVAFDSAAAENLEEPVRPPGWWMGYVHRARKAKAKAEEDKAEKSTLRQSRGAAQRDAI